MKKIFSGFTNKTGENLLLDAGAYFKNYDVETDTFESAVTAGKLIGATRGGGEFKAVPEIRTVEVDGIKGRAKGLTEIDSWDVSIQANVLEVTTETLKLGLGVATIDTPTEGKYDIVTAKNSIEDEDYLDNITWVGQLSGSNEPVIIQVYNTLNIEGLTLATAPKGEAVTSMTFAGHYKQDDLNTPPFKIYYPKAS
ncbi:hypothetical protein [Abyssisolibacter fermentans]|uniref:hypothetical protein n=1 Tax=Abyssisolibacter fermentans TaxID=1766203 RepID=UPI000829C258|nr:hypothetical protein [Abyssisolibacter fermentans]